MSLCAAKHASRLSGAFAIVSCALGCTGGTTYIGADEHAFTPGDAGSPACDAPTPATDSCLSVAALTAEPVIDGSLECGLSLQDIPTSTWFSTVREPLPPQVSARYAVGWRPNGLYFFVEVTTPVRRASDTEDPAFCGDAVHLFADTDGQYSAPPDYDVPGTVQFVAGAPGPDVPGLVRGWKYAKDSGLGEWTSGNFGAFATNTGYAVEALLTAADLGVSSWELNADQNVGVNVSISVSGPAAANHDCGKRIGDFRLRMAPGMIAYEATPHRNVQSFCNPMLTSTT